MEQCKEGLRATSDPDSDARMSNPAQHSLADDAQALMLEAVRALAPTVPLLIPGVGAQGGDAAATVRAGWRPNGPIVVNSSRAILYASNGADFAAAARTQATNTRDMLQAPRPRYAIHALQKETC